jgi:hypothetical protein
MRLGILVKQGCLLELKNDFFSMIGQNLLNNLSKFVIDANWLDRLVI